MFQSLVDDVIQRGRLADGSTDTTRPTMTHPLVSAATAFVKHLHDGIDPPDTAPDEVSAVEGGSVGWECIKLTGELFESDDERVKELEDALKGSTCDPQWAEAITEYLKYFGADGKKNAIPYVTYEHMSDFVLETLPRNARVAIVRKVQ